MAESSGTTWTPSAGFSQIAYTHSSGAGNSAISEYMTSIVTSGTQTAIALGTVADLLYASVAAFKLNSSPSTQPGFRLPTATDLGLWGTRAILGPYATSAIGGGSLTAACTSGAVSVPGATTGMTAYAMPVTYPGDNVMWDAYVNAANSVTVKVCVAVGPTTPTSTVYNVRVVQ
jgi:hypothetical protein